MSDPVDIFTRAEIGKIVSGIRYGQGLGDMRLSTAAILRERREERIESITGVVKAVMRNTGKTFNETCNVMEIPDAERGAILEFLENLSQEKEENSEEVSEEDDDVPIDGDADLYEEYDYYGNDSSLEDETDVETEADSAVDAEDDASVVSPLKDQTPSYGGVSGYQEFRLEKNRDNEKSKSKDRDEGR